MGFCRPRLVGNPIAAAADPRRYVEKMKRAFTAVILLQWLAYPIPGICATRHSLATGPGGEFAFWCRTPAHYWLTRSWKIPYRLVMAATGPGGSIMEERCALGRNSGEIIFDGVLGDGKRNCSGAWSGGGTRYVEGCGGYPITLYLLPEKKTMALRKGFFKWAEKDSTTMFSVGFSSQTRGHLEIVELTLPETEPKTIFISEQPLPFGGFGVHNAKVCGDHLIISFEQRSGEFSHDRGPLSAGLPDVNSMGVMTFDIKRRAAMGVRNYPLTHETYKDSNENLCSMGI